MKRIIIFMLALVSAAAFADVEIIVTASRIDEDSKTTPAYVRVIPEEEIQKETTILDVLKTVPDIMVSGTSPAKQSVSMGGFGDGGYGRTLILLNGRPMNRPDMAAFDLNSITLTSVERIEIIKGPVASQYGDQAVAGVINIITKEPDGLAVNISASMNSTLSNNESAYISLGNETAGAALGLNRGNYISSRDRSDSDSLSANLDSYYKLSFMDIGLGAFYSNNSYQLPGGISEVQFKDNPDQAGNPSDEGSTANYGVNSSFVFNLGAMDFTMPLSFTGITQLSDMASWPSFSNTVINQLSTGIIGNTSFFAGDSFELTPVVGFDFMKSDQKVDSFDSASRSNKTGEESFSRIDTAAWGRTKLNYLDMVVVDTGIRYNLSTLNTSPKIEHNKLVYDAGLVFPGIQNMLFSLRYGKVFRYPNFNEQVEYGTVNEDLKPETGNNFTAYLEYERGNFRISVAPYFNMMDDEIVYSMVTFSNENTGSTLHYGACVESGYFKGIFTISAGYAYDHAEFTETTKIIPRVPEHTVYGTLSVSPVKSVTVSTDGRYSSQFYTDEANTDSVPGRFEWNVEANWDITKSLVWYLKANNILNDRTPTFAYGNTSWYPMQGRTFESGLKWVY